MLRFGCRASVKILLGIRWTKKSKLDSGLDTDPVEVIGAGSSLIIWGMICCI